MDIKVFTAKVEEKRAEHYLRVTLAFLALGVIALAVFATAQDATVNLTAAARLTMSLCAAPVVLASAFFAQHFFKVHSDVAAEQARDHN